MSTMTFLGRTTREAMALAKARFGPDVEIVESRQTAEGVELTAIVHGVALQRRHLQPQVAAGMRPASNLAKTGSGLARLAAATREARSAEAQPQAPAPAIRAVDPKPARAGNEPMSTVSFEAFVRERQEQKSSDPAELTAPAGVLRPAAAQPKAATPASALTMPGGRSAQPAASAANATARAPGAVTVNASAELMAELQSIKRFVAGQLETVRWFDTARRRPAQIRMLRMLLAAQFSPPLAKSLCDLLPMDFNDEEADRWLVRTLARSISSFNAGREIATPKSSDATCFDEGGVFALTGPTGVGKTTSVAKIAARHALRHGAASVALITADVYRIAAQDQLRAFGKMLGVAVHVAHDHSALTDLLGLFGDRKLVLIDTAGLGQRDERVGQLVEALDMEPIRRVVVLSAAMQAATLQDVVTAYRAPEAAGVLLSKTDEAVQLGGLLDCVIRNRLALLATTDGQRVPEDFHAPDLPGLAATAIASGGAGQVGELADGELRFILESAGV